MKTQKFKGRELTKTKTVNNILRVYDSSDSFKLNDWYQQANDYAMSLSEKYGVDFLKVCGILAALSPLKSWDLNKKIAVEFLEGNYNIHTKSNVNKAKEIRSLKISDALQISEVLRGNKVTSFFLNIYEPSLQETVTIDRHALCIGVGEVLKESELRGLTETQYKFFVNCYKIAATKRNVKPLMMQSVTWEQWRKQKSK